MKEGEKVSQEELRELYRSRLNQLKGSMTLPKLNSVFSQITPACI